MYIHTDIVSVLKAKVCLTQLMSLKQTNQSIIWGILTVIESKALRIFVESIQKLALTVWVWLVVKKQFISQTSPKQLNSILD